MAKPMMWIAGALFVALAAREWWASRRMRMMARAEERRLGRPEEQLTEESFMARLSWTVIAFVLGLMLYRFDQDLLLAVSFGAAAVLFVIWALTR